MSDRACRRATDDRRARPSTSRSSCVFVAITLVIVFRASRNNKTAADYYAGGRVFTGPQNGIAISGDYLSAASFLGIAGAIAINGYDGFLYSIGFLVAWLVALLLVAELLRNTGSSPWPTCWLPAAAAARCAWRRRSRRWPCRSSTCSPRWPAPAAWSRCCSASSGQAGQSRRRSPSSASLMIIYVLVGGMKGTTWVQIIKAVAAHRRRRRHDGAGCSASTASTCPPCSAAQRRRAPRTAPASLDAGRCSTAQTEHVASSTSSRWRSRWCSAPRACRTC